MKLINEINKWFINLFINLLMKLINEIFFGLKKNSINFTTGSNWTMLGGGSGEGGGGISGVGVKNYPTSENFSKVKTCMCLYMNCNITLRYY